MMTRAERQARRCTFNARAYIFFKGLGITHKGLQKKVNGTVQPNGKPWPTPAKVTEEPKEAIPTALQTPPTTTKVVKKNTEKTESTQEDSVVSEQPKNEPVKVVEVKDDEIDYLPETEMEKVLKPKKNYRKNGKKGRKEAMKAAKKSA